MTKELQLWDAKIENGDEEINGPTADGDDTEPIVMDFVLLAYLGYSE